MTHRANGSPRNLDSLILLLGGVQCEAVHEPLSHHTRANSRNVLVLQFALAKPCQCRVPSLPVHGLGSLVLGLAPVGWPPCFTVQYFVLCLHRHVSVYGGDGMHRLAGIEIADSDSAPLCIRLGTCGGDFCGLLLCVSQMEMCIRWR